MIRCRCGEICKSYCKQCSVFVCDRCVNLYFYGHSRHKLCSVERGITEIPLRGAELLKELRKVGIQLAIRKANNMVNHQHQICERIEKELLEFFSEVDREIASLKEKCLGKFWAQKRDPPDSVSAANSQLLNVRNAITQLKETLEYENCDINELQKNCLNAFDLINFAISQSKQIPWESENKFECYEHDEERIRDEVALEFLSGVHKQMTAARVFIWLRNQLDLSSLELF